MYVLIRSAFADARALQPTLYSAFVDVSFRFLQQLGLCQKIVHLITDSHQLCLIFPCASVSFAQLYPKLPEEREKQRHQHFFSLLM
jgi:hypothetical protein